MSTTLSIAPSCLNETWYSSGLGPSSDWDLVLGNPYGTSCWYPREDQSITISPAICPLGYVSACDVPTTANAGEMVWACCPSGFTCDGGLYSCSSQYGGNQTVAASATDRIGRITSTIITTDGINAHSIRVAWRPSDVVVTPLPTASSNQATSTATPTISTTNPAADAGPSNTANLSIGATIGVGVGIGIGVLLLGIAGLSWKRYRSQKQAPVIKEQYHGGVIPTPSPSYPTPDPSSVNTNMSPPAVSEMNGAPSLYELDSKARGGTA